MSTLECSLEEHCLPLGVKDYLQLPFSDFLQELRCSASKGYTCLKIEKLTPVYGIDTKGQYCVQLNISYCLENKTISTSKIWSLYSPSKKWPVDRTIN